MRPSSAARPGPLSPPAMTQSRSASFKSSSGPNSGSRLRNFTAAPGSTKMFDPVDVIGILDADAHPHVARPIEVRAQLLQTLGSLGEDLVRVLGRVPHGAGYAADELQRHLVMEEIGHRIDEDSPPCLPGPRQQESRLIEADDVVPFRPTAGDAGGARILRLPMASRRRASRIA